MGRPHGFIRTVKDEPHVQILAIGYYDGVTEGFLHGSEAVSYFRLIAWDQEQDQRLFVFADVDNQDLVQLEEQLKASGHASKRCIWLPGWRFAESSLAAEATPSPNAAEIS